MASQQNNDKNRKSEAQKAFEEADNAGRFSGNNADAKAAREQGMENIRQDTGSGREERDQSVDPVATESLTRQMMEMQIMLAMKQRKS